MISERISDNIFPQIKILITVIPILMHFKSLQLCLKLERCKPHKAACHPTKCDVINEVKQFPTVYRRIYCRKLLTLSNQMSHYISKCIRIHVNLLTPKIDRMGYYEYSPVIMLELRNSLD